MPLPSWGELITMLTGVAAGFGWWAKRRDRIAQLEAQVKELEAKLAAVMSESTKALDSHQAAITSKNAEIAEWRRRSERQEDLLERRNARIDALEDRLYTGGGRP